MNNSKFAEDNATGMEQEALGNLLEEVMNRSDDVGDALNEDQVPEVPSLNPGGDQSCVENAEQLRRASTCSDGTSPQNAVRRKPSFIPKTCGTPDSSKLKKVPLEPIRKVGILGKKLKESEETLLNKKQETNKLRKDCERLVNEKKDFLLKEAEMMNTIAQLEIQLKDAEMREKAHAKQEEKITELKNSLEKLQEDRSFYCSIS